MTIDDLVERIYKLRTSFEMDHTIFITHDERREILVDPGIRMLGPEGLRSFVEDGIFMGVHVIAVRKVPS